MDVQQGEDEGHADVDAVLDLAEIGRAGVLVDLDGDLVDARQGVQDVHVVLSPAHDPGCQDIEILQADVVLFIEEALALDAGHIENVEAADHIVEPDKLLIGDVVFLQLLDDIVGDFQFIGGNKGKADSVVAGHGGDQGVDGTAELEVAAQADGHIVKAASQGPDGQHVGQSLGRMLVAAVAAVDHGNAGGLFGHHGGTLLGMADCGDVREAGDGPDGIRDALALGDGGTGRIRKAHRAAAQVQHGGLRGQTRARRGLIEERCQLFAPAGIGIFFRIRFDVSREIEDLVELAYRKVQRCQYMAHTRSFLLRLSARSQEGPEGPGAEGNRQCERNRRSSSLRGTGIFLFQNITAFPSIVKRNIGLRSF